MERSYVGYLYGLAQELGCGLRLVPNLDGMMYVEFGYVEGPHPETTTRHTPQISFAVCLHELGHFYHGHTQGRPPMGHLTHYFDNGVLRSEAEAWDFAFEHFDIYGEAIEDETKNDMWGRCLGSYYGGARVAGKTPSRLYNGDRGYVSFIYDDPDDLFQAVQARMQQA